MTNQTIYPYGQGGQLPTGYPIADDLNTDSAQQSLSARQGKIIGQKIITFVPIKISDYKSCAGLVAAGGKWTTTSAHRHVQMKVNPGEVYLINAGVNETQYAFFTQTSAWSNAGDPPYSPGETGRHTISAGNSAEITIPAGCEYLYVALSNGVNPGTDLTPQSISLKKDVNQVIKEDISSLKGEIDGLRGSFHEFWDYETATVLSNGSSKITIEKSNGEIIVTNVNKTNSYYALIQLPSAMLPGKTYTMTLEYTAGFNSPTSGWWLGFADSSYSLTSGGVNLAPGKRKKVEYVFTLAQNSVYMRLASSSENTGAQVVFHSISFTDNVTTVADLTERVASLESGSGSSEMENLIRQARFVANGATTSALALLHFTDIHGDTAAAAFIKAFATKYASYIDDLVQTGDTVYYYWNSAGQGYEWYQQHGMPEALFVLGNHDGAANSDEHGWKEGSGDWDFKGKEWDFDTYFAPYITERGVTHPVGYDDSSSPYYKACYWHKDYADAKVRVIGLDCLHFNDGVRYTSNDQETWLAARLQETITSGNAAKGYSVVFLCHYPIDDFTGDNETWNDSTHKFTYNQNATGGGVMDRYTNHQVAFHTGSSFTAEAKFSMRNRVGEVGSPDYSKGQNNPIGEVIQSWINSGGKFIAWLSGHTHTEYMYYSAKFPTMLCVGLPQAGNTRGTSAADRGADSDMHAAANLCVIDTANTLFKIIRIGYTLDKTLISKQYLCYNYSTKTVISCR